MNPDYSLADWVSYRGTLKAERMLNAELDHHLGSAGEEDCGNHRNGYGSKTVITDTGKLELSIPRDRHGRFDPVLIGKYRRRFAGFDDKIIALYARGMTTREIAEHIGELYAAEISADLVSAVTDSVLEEVAAWQSRGLDATYAVVFFDAIRVKIRNEGMVSNRAVYLAIGIRCSGQQGDPGNLDRADRRREVLAAGDERTAQPRGPGHPDRGGRRTQRLSRGNYLCVS
jgi:transposase-like protein